MGVWAARMLTHAIVGFLCLRALSALLNDSSEAAHLKLEEICSHYDLQVRDRLVKKTQDSSEIGLMALEQASHDAPW